MDESNRKEFAILFYGTAELYDKSVTKNLLQLYFNSLKHYSIEQVKEGINKHVLDPKHGTFFPKPADIIRGIWSGDITTEEKAELAWSQIQREIRVTGSWGKLVIDDKQGLAALKAFTSWKDLCSMHIDKMTWAKKEFISMYSTYENTPLEMLPSSLLGRVELVQHKKETNKSMAKVLADINVKKLKSKGK